MIKKESMMIGIVDNVVVCLLRSSFLFLLSLFSFKHTMCFCFKVALKLCEVNRNEAKYYFDDRKFVLDFIEEINDIIK